jgi:hypothetical protein
VFTTQPAISTDTSLTSPAVVALREVPGAHQTLFAGQVVDATGRPVKGAVLWFWGLELQSEERGNFELLAYGAPSLSEPTAVTVTAPGHLPAHRLVVDNGTTRLADGTIVVLRTFVLSCGGA